MSAVSGYWRISLIAMGGMAHIAHCYANNRIPQTYIRYKCLRYPVIGTYRSLLWVVLRNERILRDKRNSINVVFVLAFLCSLVVYIPLLCLMSSLLLLLLLVY